MDEKRVDTAAEPVETQEDEFMDTGVLHERPKKKSDDEDEGEGE